MNYIQILKSEFDGMIIKLDNFKKTNLKQNEKKNDNLVFNIRYDFHIMRRNNIITR